MDQSNPKGRSKLVKADINLAVDLLNAGDSLEVVQARLLERGLDEGTAAATIRHLLTPAIYNEAAAMLQSGSSRSQVEEELVNKGLDPLVARAVINKKVVSQSPPEARPTEGIG